MPDIEQRDKSNERLGLAFCVLLFLVFYGQYLIGYSPSGGDIVNQYLPYQQLIRDAVRSGHWPLWNALTFCGRPLMGDIQVGVLYPPNWLHWVLPLPLSFALVFAAHGAWMIAGCWRLGRAWRLSPAAISLATALFVASPFFTLKMSQGIILFTYVGAWWPWIALGVTRLIEKSNFERALLLAVAMLMSLLAGSPQLTYYGWIGAGLLAMVLPRPPATNTLPDASPLHNWLRGMLWLAFAFALTAGLSAIQTMQSADFIGASFERANGAPWDYVTNGSFAPRLLWLLLNPGFFGPGRDTLDPASIVSLLAIEPNLGSNSGLYWASTLDYAEACYYLPLWVPLMLVPAALAWLLSRRGSALHRRLGWLALGCIVGGLALAPGESSPLFKLFFYVVPGFNRFRVPARLMIFYLGGCTLLAALIVDQLVRGAIPGRVLRAVALLGASVAFIAIGASWLADSSLWRLLDNPITRAGVAGTVKAQAAAEFYGSLIGNFAMRTALGVAAASFVLWAMARTSARDSMRRAIWLLPLAAMAELAWLALPYRNDAGIAEYYATNYPRTELVQALQREHRGGRVLWLDDTIDWKVDQNQREIYPNRLVMQGLADARGYDPVNARWIGEWMNLLSNHEPSANPRGFMFVEAIGSRPAMLTLMGVESIVSYQDFSSLPGMDRAASFDFAGHTLNVWRNRNFRGMAFAVARPQLAKPMSDMAWRDSLYTTAQLAENVQANPLQIVAADSEPIQALLNAEPQLSTTIDERFKVSPDPAPTHSTGATGGGAGTPAHAENANNGYGYTTDFPAPALVYFAQSAYDGWVARVDGRPVETAIVSGAFLAAPVPAGQHALRFTYEPIAFSNGSTTSIAALVVAGYGLIRGRLRRRRA